MKKTFRPILFAAVLLAGCFRPEIQTSTYHIPALTNATVVAEIETTLKQMHPGGPDNSWIAAIHADLETCTLTVDYHSTYIRSINIEEKIAEMGLDINYRPANPAAKTQREKETQ